MEPNIPGQNEEFKEEVVMKNLVQPILRQPLIYRHQQRPGTAQMFQFEEGEDDLDLFDDGEDDYYEDEIYKLVQSYAPTPVVSEVVNNNNTEGKSEAALINYFDVPSNLAKCFDELEQKMTDLNEEGTVKKEIIRPGNGVKVPESGRVYYHYMAIVEGCPDVWDLSVLQKYPKFTDLKNASNLVQGFETALLSMDIKEVARFLVYPTMAYGEVGCPPHIPANVKIMYVVETLHYIDEEKLNSPLYMGLTERSELPFQEIFDVANALCFEGNKCHEATDYQLALKKWQKGVQLLEEYPSANASEEESKRKSHSLFCMYSNAAQAYLKLEKPAQACNACEQGLQLTHGENSIKLLYRFSKAKLMLKDCDGALQLVEKALRYRENDPNLQRLEREIYLEDAYQRGVIKSVKVDVVNSAPISAVEASPQPGASDVVNSAPESAVQTSPQQGPSDVVKGSNLQMKDREDTSSPKGSPARILKAFFAKKKSEKK